MGPHAKLIHSGGSFYCEHLGKALTLGLGLDGSAVLHLPGPLPPGWLVQALDQLFIAAPQLTVLPCRMPSGAMHHRRWLCLP